MGWMVFSSKPQWEWDILDQFRPALRPTQSPVQWVLGFFSGVKWWGHGTDHPPLPSACVRCGWSYTSASDLCLPGVLQREIKPVSVCCLSTLVLSFSLFHNFQFSAPQHMGCLTWYMCRVKGDLLVDAFWKIVALETEKNIGASN